MRILQSVPESLFRHVSTKLHGAAVVVKLGLMFDQPQFRIQAEILAAKARFVQEAQQYVVV